MSTTSRGPSRRTLVKGAAWSVPVVAMAAPAHAVGASQCVTYSYGDGSYKCPGQSTDSPFGYGIRFCITNTCPDSAPCQDVTLLLNMPVTTNSGAVLVPDADYGAVAVGEVCPGEEICSQQVFTFSSTNSASTLYFYVSINGGDPEQVSMSAPPKCPRTTSKSSDVEVDEAPASTDAETAEPAPAPAAPVAPATDESAPAPAPADDASATSTP